MRLTHTAARVAVRSVDWCVVFHCANVADKYRTCLFTELLKDNFLQGLATADDTFRKTVVHIFGSTCVQLGSSGVSGSRGMQGPPLADVTTQEINVSNPLMD